MIDTEKYNLHDIPNRCCCHITEDELVIIVAEQSRCQYDRIHISDWGDCSKDHKQVKDSKSGSYQIL